jgi:hypothetical protein
MAKVAWNDMTAFAKVIVEDYKLFEGLDLVPLETYEGMDTRPAWEFKAPMATGFYKPYILKGSDRVEKITVGELHYMGRAKYCALNMTASNDYDLPIYACEFDETAPRVGVTMDLMPTVDISQHEEYREKYYREIAPLWRKYRTIPGFTHEGRCLVQRRYGPWPWARESLSPFSLDGRVEEKEDREKLMEAVVAYARVWLELLKKAEPIRDDGYRQEMLRRKKKLQKYYRDLDPGGEVMKKIFGEGKHHLFVSLVF